MVIPPDTELQGLTWVPYLLFSAHNQCRSMAPSRQSIRYSNLIEGRRRSRAHSIDGSKVRSNTAVAVQSSDLTRPRASTLMPLTSTSFSSLKDQVQLVKSKIRNGKEQRPRLLHHHKRTSSDPNTATMLSSSSMIPLSPVLSQNEDAEAEEKERQTLGAAMIGIETFAKLSSDYHHPSSSSFNHYGIRLDPNSSFGTSSVNRDHSPVSFTLTFGHGSSASHSSPHRAIEMSIPPDCVPSASSDFVERSSKTSSTAFQSFHRPSQPNPTTSFRHKSRFSLQDGPDGASEPRRQSAPSLIQTNTYRNHDVESSPQTPSYEADWMSKLLRKQLVQEEGAFEVEKGLKLDLDFLGD